MKYIISTLQKANNFHMDYQAPCINKATCAQDVEDGLGATTKLAGHVAEQRALNPGKFILLKHQYWLNFTEHGMEQPTYINVVRDPVTRFSSMYYFNRYGFKSMGSEARQVNSVIPRKKFIFFITVTPPLDPQKVFIF